MKYAPTIGIECHVQLMTKTKLFSGVGNDARGQEPNACVSPVDYALPGTLPVLNKEAVRLAVLVGLALNSEINLASRFDRKHYFYPDLPKGYQISQFYQPIIGDGSVALPDGSSVRIEHAHLEEDAGKLTHFGDYSLVDLNRAGTPLVEIVSMPDIHSAKQARLYCEELHKLMVYAGASHGDLYHGNIRFDVNISVSTDETLGTRCEVKNLNSFKSVEGAAEYEYARQVKILEDGGKVVQETRGWNDGAGVTSSQRSKEESQDYRYMPEPDVPPIVLTSEFVEKCAEELPMMPAAYREEFAVLELPESVVETILSSQVLAKKLIAVLNESDTPAATRVANWFSSILLAEENVGLDYDRLPVAHLVELSQMVGERELSSTASKQILLELFDPKNTSKGPRVLAGEMNLLQENDADALAAIVDEVIASPECAQAVADVRGGKMKAVGFLVGQVMKRSGGKANPASVGELLREKLV